MTVIDLFDRSASLQPMWKQVEGFKAAIYPIMQNAADGVHFICYSQGVCDLLRFKKYCVLSLIFVNTNIVEFNTVDKQIDMSTFPMP